MTLFGGPTVLYIRRTCLELKPSYRKALALETLANSRKTGGTRPKVWRAAPVLSRSPVMWKRRYFELERRTNGGDGLAKASE